MSLMVFVKNDSEGFAFSDGAISNEEYGITRSGVSKIVPCGKGSVVGAGGTGPASIIFLQKIARLPSDVSFEDVLSFISAEVAEHFSDLWPDPAGNGLSA
jgi:hypothetical protein